MRRFESQGDFIAIFRGDVDVAPSTLDFGIDFATLDLPERQIVCVEKVVVKSELQEFEKSNDASLTAKLNLISGGKEKFKTYLVDSGETRLIDGLFVDFNSSQSFKSLRGDALVQEFFTETYLSDKVLIKLSATTTNINFQSEALAKVKFEILLLGYKFILNNDSRRKILKVDV